MQLSRVDPSSSSTTRSFKVAFYYLKKLSFKVALYIYISKTRFYKLVIKWLTKVAL